MKLFSNFAIILFIKVDSSARLNWFHNSPSIFTNQDSALRGNNSVLNTSNSLAKFIDGYSNKVNGNFEYVIVFLQIFLDIVQKQS